MNTKLFYTISKDMSLAEDKLTESVELLKKDKTNIELIHKKELSQLEFDILRKIKNYLYIY